MYHRLNRFAKSEDLPDLAMAVKLADCAARMGQPTPVIIRAGETLDLEILSIMEGPHELENPDMANIRKIAPGCDALEKCLRRRNHVLVEDHRNQALKEMRAPNKYQCARVGCVIHALSQKSLFRCGGPCSPEEKPHYCSKECQKLVSQHNLHINCL